MEWTKKAHFNNFNNLLLPESLLFSKDFLCLLQKGNNNCKSNLPLDKTLFHEEDQVALFQKFIQTLISNWKKQLNEEKKF